MSLSLPLAMKVAQAAARDAGDRHAEQHGLTEWTEVEIGIALAVENAVLVALGKAPTAMRGRKDPRWDAIFAECLAAVKAAGTSGSDK